MVDQPSRRRRIVRRAALSVAAVVLLLWGYVSSWGATRWWIGRHLPQGLIYSMAAPGGDPLYGPVTQTSEVIHAPLYWYEVSDCPGARTLHAFDIWCTFNGMSDGKYVSWEEASTPFAP